MSDTPRTDNFKSQGREWLPLGIFEKLERENTNLRNALERIGTDASAIQCLSYGPDGDCGAVSIAERIEYECDQILQANV